MYHLLWSKGLLPLQTSFNLVEEAFYHISLREEMIPAKHQPRQIVRIFYQTQVFSVKTVHVLRHCIALTLSQ
jgi:hypothetical protein